MSGAEEKPTTCLHRLSPQSPECQWLPVALEHGNRDRREDRRGATLAARRRCRHGFRHRGRRSERRANDRRAHRDASRTTQRSHCVERSARPGSPADDPGDNPSQSMRWRSLKAEIACALRIPSAPPRTDSPRPRARPPLPWTLPALKAGEISYRHAEALVDSVAGLDADAAAGCRDHRPAVCWQTDRRQIRTQAPHPSERANPESCRAA